MKKLICNSRRGGVKTCSFALCSLTQILFLSVVSVAAFAGENLVRNGSFESYTGDVSGSWVSFSDSLTLDDWNPSLSGPIGLAASKNGTWFANTCVTPDGNLAVFFNQAVSVSQENIVVSEAGLYSVSFKYVSRGGSYKDGVFYVEIDGAVVGDGIDVGSDKTLFRYAERRTYLPAGTHTLTIRHSDENNKRLNNSGGACSCIDAVLMQKVEDVDNLVQNGSFEAYNGVFPHLYASFSSTLGPYGWEYVTESQIGLADSTNGTWFASPCTMPDGDLALFFNRGGSISRQITVAESGLHVVGFDYISRGQPSSKSNYQNGLFYLEIDDAVVGEPVDVGAVRTVFRTALWKVSLAKGSHTLTIRHSSENNVRGVTVFGNRTGDGACSAIDAVFARKTDNLVLNGTFDFGKVTGTWKYSYEAADAYDNPCWRDEGYVGLSETNNTWIATSVDAGKYGCFLQTANYNTRQYPTASLYQTFTVPSAGVYRVSFDYAGRPRYAGATVFARIYKGTDRTGVKVWEKSVVASGTASYASFGADAHIREPGAYTLEFYQEELVNTGTTSNDKASAIDNVAIVYSRRLPGLMIVIR